MKKHSKSLMMVLVGFFVCLLFSGIAYGAESNEKVEKLMSKTIRIGRIKASSEVVQIKDAALPIYECMEKQYVAVNDLKQLGAHVTWNPNTKVTLIYDFAQPAKNNITFEKLEEGATAYLGRGLTYINYQEIPSIFVGNKTLIPVEWLSLIEKDSSWVRYNYIQEVDIGGINIWYDGEKYVEEIFSCDRLEPDEYLYHKNSNENNDVNSEYTYVGFIITTLNGEINNDVDSQKSWLQDPIYYTINIEPESPLLEELFPPNIIQGTIKYNTSGFIKGEVIEVARADSGIAYYVFNQNRSIVKIPWNSVSIIKTPTTMEKAPVEQIEQYINGKDFESKTNYLVWTDLYRQRTYVFQGNKNNWKLLKDMPSSTGRDITPTPKGEFTLTRRVPSFGKGYMAKNAVAFIGTEYLYHSVLYDATGKYLLEGRGILGQKASQGCIRFSPEDSVWFYRTMPLGTKVYIN